MSERDRLDELGAELPWDRPDDARRSAVRSSLLSAAAETSGRRSIGRWFVVGGAFACGAAAAVIAVSLWPRGPQDEGQLARVEASPAARVEDTVTRTATGSDETVRVHGGRVRLAVGELRRGDRVRVKTSDAVVEGVGAYEVSVANDALNEVTVQSGTAEIHVSGRQAVFLATGQTWRASVVTADLEPAPPKADPAGVAPNSPTSPDPSSSNAPASPDSAAPSNTTSSNAGSPNASLSNATSSNAISKATPSNTSSNVTSKATPPSSSSNTSSPNATLSTSNAVSKATPSNTTSSNTTASNATSSNTPSSRTVSSNPASPSATTKSSTNTSANTTKPSTLDPLDEPLPTATRPAISTGSASSTTSATSAARGKSPTEQHLQAGWELLRAGKAAEAANELGKAADGEGDLAADARYFQSIALIRAGRSADAERALVGFLDHAPKSIRRGRASVMLARLLAARGDSKSARAWFESALQDPDASVVAAARDALAALH